MTKTTANQMYAGGFLFNPRKDTILLHLRDGHTDINPHKWSFFGGGVEGDEKPIECFIREMREEIGLNISEDKIQPVCNYWNDERQTWRYIFYAESDVDTKNLTLGEGAGFEWVPIARVFSYDLTDKARNDLKAFLSMKGKI